jgi:hypothetical protein
MSKLVIRQIVDQFSWILYDGKNNISAQSRFYDTRKEAVTAAEEHAHAYTKAFSDNYVDQTPEAKIEAKNGGKN